MRILHIADVHLDRPFSGLSPELAKERRAEVFATFRRCLGIARERDADLVTIGGDLWEDENVTLDTRRSVAHELGLLGLPVVMISGNHDPLIPGGNYARTSWPANVHLFSMSSPSEHKIGGVSLWGLSWGAEPLVADFLAAFRAPHDEGRQVLLIHGTAQSVGVAFEGAHCPFAPSAARSAGFDLVLAGHIHQASYNEGVVYPGSPEPLGWGETGRHCCALVHLGPDGVDVDLIDVNARSYKTVDVDCDDAGSSAEIGTRIDAAIAALEAPHTTCLRVRLTGTIDAACEVDVVQLQRDRGVHVSVLALEDHTHAAWDLDALARSPTADGRFVAKLKVLIDAATDPAEREVAELALDAGLRAMNDMGEPLHVD
jgi:DNA repair exonuclease SbcCD nuclease subunit